VIGQLINPRRHVPARVFHLQEPDMAAAKTRGSRDQERKKSISALKFPTSLGASLFINIPGYRVFLYLNSLEDMLRAPYHAY
jgi:hypothetical protein